MVGPSIMLAGLALGSGEFIIWPHIVYKSGFVFFWACMLGVITQFLMNMEIERWTLATGESATTGFCRLNRHWAWIMLALTIVPFAWPGWATGAANILSWLIYGPVEITAADGSVTYSARHVRPLAIGGLLLVGIVLTAGPVVYNTVERIQTYLVGLILILVIILALAVVRGDAVSAMLRGTMNLGGMPDMDASGLTFMGLLGALAFAGAGGAMNLGQSNFIKDKGYGMGCYIGRITSPITGQQEATADFGFRFPQNDANLSRWKQWWRAANIEHFFSFLLTCVVCLCLMSLISYSLFYDEFGHLRQGMERFGEKMNFVWGQATVLSGRPAGTFMKPGFLIMGVAVLMTTELGIMDAVARICADIVKVNYLHANERWSLSRLYFCFLWGEILLGIMILLVPNLDEPLLLIKVSAAMNGAVMFLYSMILLKLNSRLLTGALAISPIRKLTLVWSTLFFGFFTLAAFRYGILPVLTG